MTTTHRSRLSEKLIFHLKTLCIIYDRHSVVLRGLHTENGMVIGGASNSTTDQLIGVLFATPITTIIFSGKGYGKS